MKRVVTKLKNYKRIGYDRTRIFSRSINAVVTRLWRRSLIYRRPAHCAWPWTSHLFARVRAVSEKSRNEAPHGSYLASKGDSTRPSRASLPRIMTVGHLFTSSIGASATCPWPVMIHWPDRAANAAPTYQRYRFPRRTDDARERISRLDITTRANRGRRTMHSAIALRSLPDSCYATIVGDVSVVDRLRIVKARNLCKFQRFLWTKFVDIIFFRNFKKGFRILKSFFSMSLCAKIILRYSIRNVLKI